jgi:iron complex outermembrane receptor protein
MLAFRGSYSTAFRVPTFTDLFNPISFSQIFESFADPAICPGARPNPAIAGCVDLADRAADPNAPILQSVSGGKPNAGPEDAELVTVGFVLEPMTGFSASLDWWRIERSNTLRSTTRAELIANYELFKENFVRDSNGRIILIDQRVVNAGGSLTEGYELSLRGRHDAFGGRFSFGLDGSFIQNAQDKVLPTLPYGPNLRSTFTQAGELFLKYKHNAFVSFTADTWNASLSQQYKAGYTNQVLDGIKDGLVTPPGLVKEVEPYIVYNASATYTGFDGVLITAGIRNLLDTDPPFAISYLTQTGGGANWEPRVADPRGRSFTLAIEYKF